ncbi:RNA polymerase, sigma subunit, ECF family [Burkholderia sp. OK233]|nr:RNA polymerase, sigma subunit, ECF family [Burkholderia sp. OK233]
MLRHPHLPHPVPGSETGNPESFTSARQAEPLVSRADGKLDWSIAMASAQTGDQEAYRRLLRDITPYLRALAARHIRNADDIEDTVQDVLLTVHSVRHTYDPSRPFGPWLVAIANRRIVDSLRRCGRVGAHETSGEMELETFAADEANLQEEAVNARLVREAIEQLSVGQRDAMRMLKLEEMSLQEAAAVSGMSVAALKVATHRAMKRLREMFQQRGSKS